MWTGLGWVTPDRVDKLLLGHTVRQDCLGGADRSLSGQHQRCVSRLIGSDPTRILKGLGVTARTVSLLPLASGKQGGIHHSHTGWEPTSLTQSDQPASRRLTGCVPYSPHHPSQPVMRYLLGANGSDSGISLTASSYQNRIQRRTSRQASPPYQNRASGLRPTGLIALLRVLRTRRRSLRSRPG